MKIVLLCNYAPDAQQSMLRFGALLEREWLARGREVRTVAPQPGRISAALMRRSGAGGRKWLGYFDKYVRFPRQLARERREFAGGERTLVHVVDHSNAVYVPRRAEPRTKWLVTCHDLLAVRGARGEDTDCPASALGKKLQQAIVRGLGRAAAIACDSTSTLRDAERLVAATGAQARRVIFLGPNHPYTRVDAEEAQRRLRGCGGVPWTQPFVVHVGSNLPRKNKPGVLRVFARAAERWPGNLVFCGAPLPDELRAQARAAGIAERVFAVPSLSNSELEAAYGAAHALLFPSRCEGFGWPVIEAQACGCPVICSDRTSLPEIGGEGALVHALEDEAGMAESVLRLAEPEFRAAVIARGDGNLRRFTTEGMIDAYAALYEEVAVGAASR